MTAPAKETTSVTVERVISASPERLYTAFQSRDELNGWFCNNSFVQAREGGLYLFIWNQEQYSATGIFQELVENEKIVMSWRSTWQGTESDHSETLTVTFDEVDGGTKVTFVQDGVPEDTREGYEHQWNKRLDDLKLYVETGGNPNIVNRVIIGIFPQAVPEDRHETLDLEAGTYSMVNRLVPDYSAEKAGIQVGDIITHMDGEKVGPNNPMGASVQTKKPGDTVDVTLARGDEILTLTMTLMPYPVPEIPATFADLADAIAPQYDQLIEQLTSVFEGVSEEEASTAPADGEWNAKQVLAHIIYSERWYQESIGAHLSGGQPQHWSGNDNNRLSAIAAVYPTIKDLVGALRHEYNSTLALWRHIPEDVAEANKSHLWNDAFGVFGWIQHTEGHMPQMQAAIDSARS